MDKRRQTYDFAVVGAGIAGLSIAELLQRSGASVVLLEKNSALCGEASAELHGWFHTGALYSALPDHYFCRTMVGNLDDLVDYYAGFPNMNLRIEKHISTTAQRGWFSNRTVFYAYTGLRGVGWKAKASWALALSRAKRRMSWFETLDPSRSMSHQMGVTTKPLRYVLHDGPLDVHLDHVSFTLKSRDRAMDSTLIAEDLLRSFLGSGGVLDLETRVVALDGGGVRCERQATGETIQREARHTILATGKDSSTFDRNVRVLISPLLVAVPALAEVNFVKMSPHHHETINHLFHRQGELSYSVIGNAMHYDANDWSPLLRQDVRDRMRSLARRVWPHFDAHRSEVFFGSKTEVESPATMRNYLYKIVDRGTYTLALPGKFSLCFSLAVNVCRHFGIEPVERIRMGSLDVSGLIEVPKHFQLAKQLASGVLRACPESLSLDPQ